MLDQEQVWLQAEIEELRLSAQYAVGRAAATALSDELRMTAADLAATYNAQADELQARLDDLRRSR